MILRILIPGTFAEACNAAPSDDYTSWVQSCAAGEMKRTGRKPFQRDTPLSIRVEIGIARPQSKPKDAVFHIVKPACDTMLQNIQKALESICYETGQQIVTTTISKRYSETSYATVEVWEENLI